MVASWQDVQALRPHHRMIYVEHGAGQGYAGDEKSALNPGYSTSGGARHQGVEAFICPNINVAMRWKTAPSMAVGCPKLDRWVSFAPLHQQSVCFAFHWDAQISSEARSAINHYFNHLPELAERFRDQGFHVFGHAHPKWGGLLDDVLRQAGMDVLEREDELFLNANILIVDNSSIGMEFLALGRPVVWMNAPWYRKDVNHGGRFWTWTNGVPTVDSPQELLALNLWDVLQNNPTMQAQQHVREVYGPMDGQAAQRAADFIAQLFGKQ